MAETISTTWAFYARDGRITLAAFVVMEDHWHALFATNPDGVLARQMQTACSWIGKKTSAELASHGCHWQEGYYDTRIRSAKQFRYVRRYIESNPVTAGLVVHIEEWPWTSANPRFSQYLTDPWPWGFEKDEEWQDGHWQPPS